MAAAAPPRKAPPAAPGPTDIVPAMLTPGEFVLKRDAVRRIGVGRLNQLNQGYQEGGPVYLNPVQGRLLQAGEPAPTPAVPTAPSTPPVQTPIQSPAPAQPSPLPGPTSMPADFPAEPAKVVEPKKGPPADFPAEPIKTQKPAEAKAGPPADFPAEPVKPAPQVPPAPKTGPASVEGYTSSAATAAAPAPQPAQQPAPPQTDEDIRAANIKALTEAGKTPGEAQAIVDGQEPTTVTGQKPSPKPAAPTAELVLKADAGNRVDPRALYSYLLGKFADSGLVGYVPPDGARWGIKTGSAAEWAAFGLAVAKQESDLNTRSYNAADPGGSVGLFQFGQGQTQYTKGGDQFDPQQSADAFVRSVQHFLANKGSIANMGETFGSIKRPNEAGQYIAGAQRVASGGSGKDLVSSGGGEGGGKLAKGKSKGEDILVPMAGGAAGSPAPAQAEVPRSTSGGGAGIAARPQAPEESPGGSFGGLGGIAAGALLGNLFGGRGQVGQPSREPEPPDVVTKVIQAATAPPAPGAKMPELGAGTVPLELPAGMKQANVLSVRTPGAPQLGLAAPPAAPAAPQLGFAAPPAAPAPDPIVIKGLMKQGFTRAQAEAFAAKAIVSKPGAAAIMYKRAGIAPQATPQLPPGGAKAPQVPPPPAPSRQPPAVTKPQAPPRPVSPPQAGVAPRGSTVGVPNPPGGPSPDDPRVKKQKDNLTKGEHFVAGDDFHDQLLAGLPGGHRGRQRQILGQAEEAIAEKRPMHISYISAPQEAEKFPTRESRKIQYDEHSPEARLMGTTEGQLVGHSMIPVSVGVKFPTKAGEPHQSYIQGISTNVLANNFQHVNDKLAGMGRKTPYQKLGQKFFNDLEGYYSNLNAGHTATGRGYVLGTEDHPAEPDRSHVPYKLSRAQADFIGTVINNTAAFAKHADAEKLRELARINGTLITPEGETNRLRHEIEQHEPGWRQRVLEPSIRSFKTGLVHEVHPTEEHMPATIRPGKEFQDFTRAIARTSERGRPDVPISVSLHHTLQDNKIINQIEREFSQERISEADARARLHAIGEDPDAYRFISGSGGLITPYEENPEAITPEEHNQLKDNLRKQWIGGKMPIEDYRRKTAEVPLPEIPSRRPAAQTAAPPEEEKETPAEAPAPSPIVPRKPKAPPAVEPKPPEPEIPEEKPEAPPKAPKEPPAAPTAPAQPEPAKKAAFKNVKPEEFIAQRNKSSRAGFLSELKPEDIKSHKLFTNPEGTVGAAVSPEGDIQNIFNNGGPKGHAAHAIGHAIEQHGGKTLDAYDGFLPDYYRQFGFHETGRMKFNPAFAHNWDTAKQGTPDVVFMAHKGYPEGGHAAAVERTASKDRTKWIPNEQSSRYDDDWDAQKARSRAEAVTGGEKDYRAAGVEQGSEAQPTGGEAQPGAGAAPRGAVATPPAPGDILPPAQKPKRAAKTKEQSELEAQDFEQAATDRDNISPEDASRLVRIQKLAKAWVKKNPILHGLSMHAYLTGQKKFPGKLNKEQIGEHFDDTNPKLDYNNEEHRQQASDAVVHDIMHSLAGTTTGKPSTAYGWYDRTVRKTMAKIGEIAPEILTDPDHAMAFKLALAITSQGQDVFPNAESAWHIYQHWLKKGEMPTSRKVFGGGIKAEQMEQNLAKVNDLWEKHGTEGLHKILMSRMTSRELKEKYGLDSGEKANYKVNGAMGLGPKIGAFFSNLNGDFDPTTIDLWFSRNMNLMAGNMFGFSDKAMRQDRMEKGELVKAHLSDLKDLLDSGMVSVPQQRAAKMAEELGKLQAVPEGKLDRAKARELAPEIYDWARERHKIFQKSEGYESSYHRDLKTPENVTAKKLDEATTGLSDDPRTTTERDHWRDIMARTDQSLKANKVHVTNADKQALLWFDIKDLFKMAGSQQRPKADYLDAAHRLVRKVKSGELPGLKQAKQPFSGGVLKMQGGGFVPGDFTSMVAGQPMSESDAPKAMPVVPKAQPAQTPAVTTGPATLPTGSSSASQLGDVRASLAPEFQSNPDLKRKFMALISAEAGDQSDRAKLAFAESVVNRAIARGQDLYGTLDNTYGHYFPPKTINQLGRPISDSEQKVLSPFIDKVMNGSNISYYATGNESGPEDLSEGAPITFKPGGPKDYERFMIENPDLGWASKLSPVPIVSGSFPGSE